MFLWSFWIRDDELIYVKTSVLTTRLYTQLYKWRCVSVLLTGYLFLFTNVIILCSFLFHPPASKTKTDACILLIISQAKDVYIHVSLKIKKCYLQNAHAWSAEVNWVHRINWRDTFMTSHNNHVLCLTRCLLWFWISRAAYIEWCLLSN